MRRPRGGSNEAQAAARLTWLVSAILILAGCLVSGDRSEPAAVAPAVAATERAILNEPALAASLAAVPPPVAPLGPDGLGPASIEQLRERIAAVLEREQVPGVGLALVDEDGLVWAGGVGVADLESGAPVTADTVFRVASISKSVVGLGVMRLHQENRLDLDASVHATLPEIEITNPWAADTPITLAHVLEHTAGFDDMRFNEWWGEEGMRPVDVLALNPRSRVARWRPGSRMSYANPGYTVAAHAIEQATGEAWDTYLEREVLRAVGMDRARFRRTPELAERLATGYVAPGHAAPFRPMAHAPAGGLLASPRELAGLVTLGLERGWPVVRADAFERIETATTLSYPGTDAAYGLGNYGDVMHPARAHGHDGGLPGFLSSYRYFPELGVGYVMLLNGTYSFQAYVEIRTLLFAYLAAGRELPEAPRAPVDDEAIAAVSGFYGYASPRLELFGFIEKIAVGLTLRPTPDGAEAELLSGGRIALVPTGEGGFRHARESGTSLRATTDADGRAIVVVAMSQFEARSGTWARVRLTALQAALLAMQAGFLWGLAWLLIAGIRRVRGTALARGELALHTRPALAVVSFVVLVTLVQVVFASGAFGDANPLSVALCAASLVFPAASAAALVASLRGRRGHVSLALRVIPGAAALACFGMSTWLLANGIVGLRIWTW